jgi:superfamily II RNA helicase
VQVDTSNTELKGDKLGTAFKAASGLAFVELANHEAALYTVRYLNNMQLTSRGLVVDFCLQDARKMFRRTQKLEKHQRLAMEKKAAEKKQRRDARRDSDRQPKKAAAPVTDVALLKQMKVESQSRGKKQRLNKQIAKLTGETALPSEIKASKDLKQEAKAKVQTLLRKRDEKLKDKTSIKKPVYTAEDKSLIAQQKNAKREKRRENARTEQDFDELYKTYEKKLLKRLAAPQSGPAFEQIDFSD